MNVERVTEQLKILMPENTIIKFVSSSEGGLTVFKFAINILVKEPKEFFNLVHSLNSELYSININYPGRAGYRDHGQPLPGEGMADR